MKRIPLTKGQFAIVDDADYERLRVHKWCATWTTSGFYAMRMTHGSHATRQRIFMHREILGLAGCDPRQGEHGLHDTLDNRRVVNSKPNLRIATISQNQMNRKRRQGTLTGVKGVGLDISRNKLEVKIRINGKQKRIGRYDPNQIEIARQAYRRAATEHYGEFACFE